ncbi:MAG: energy-coupling factor transporter transmembrane component T [Nitrospirota bacterium]
MQVSVRHLLPEIKILSYIIFVVSLFFLSNLKAYLFLSLILFLLLLRIPLKKIVAGWIPISLFLVFTFISNVINQHGKILAIIWTVVITEDGLIIASVRTLRILFMIIGAKILMYGTGTEDIVHALGRLLGPLERLGIPVKDFFDTMGLTLKCFPALKEMAAETYMEKMKTEKTGGFWDRAKIVSMFLLPMFIKSIRSPEVFFDKKDVNEK